MRIEAVNIGRCRQLEHAGKPVISGIVKASVAHRVMARQAGLEGDEQADRKNHGGPDKAIYAYTLENYRYWEAQLGRADMPCGQFGENLTVVGMPDSNVHIGDIFEVGAALVQVTQPRVPCFKLGIRMGLPNFVAQFMSSGRVGFYLRVLREAELQAGDPIRLTVADPAAVSVETAMRALQRGTEQKPLIRKLLNIQALSAAWRADLEKRL